MTAQRTGGQILVDQLLTHGVSKAFCVPGESYLAVLDALHDVQDQIELISARQDGSAAFMAGAYGKLTGQPGICFVTRGPGACNASIAVHTAFQDSEPMILFIGQVASDQVEREAFQEMDYRRMFGEMAKWVAQIDRADRIAEYVSHAFHCATSGRPGPVVLALPEDMLTSLAPAQTVGKYKSVQAAPSAADMAQLASLVSQAKNPMVIVGGALWNTQGVKNLQTFIENFDLPIGCAFRFQDVFDNRHPNYAGDVGIGLNPKLAARVKNADVLLTIGARLGEMTTSGYSLITPPVPQQTLIHIHNDANELGRVYQAALPICAGMNEFAAAAAALPKPSSLAYSGQAAQANAEYAVWQTTAYAPNPSSPVDMAAVVKTMERVLPVDTVYTNGAGNYATWLHRFHRYTPLRTQLAPTAGSMGYGVPAALAAKVDMRSRCAVAWSGDGCFMMNGQELATAMHYGLNVIFVVVNNGIYGTIRMHQAREYPRRVHGTTFTNPDFVALAKAYGLESCRVEKTADFESAIAAALECTTRAAHAKPYLIEIVLPADVISPSTSLEKLEAK